MKRIISLSLLMLFLIVIFSQLTSVTATELEQKPADTDLFPEEEGWIAISQASDWANIKAGGKYYLANDIVFDNRQYMPTSEDSVDVTIDGNNRTVTLSQTQRALFSSATRLTVRNIFIEGNLRYDDNAGMNSPIIRWDNYGATVLTNVISRVNYTVTNNAGTYTSISGVISKAPKDSVFKKVMYTGNITLELGTRLSGAAGITATADGASFIDCVNNGNINVKGGVTIATPGRTYFAIGGICASSDSVSSFLRCINNGNISTNARLTRYEGSLKGNMMIGGIVGYSVSDRLLDCKNSGNILQNTVQGDSPAGAMGGTVGYCKDKTKLERCSNSGRLVCEENDFSLGGIIGQADSAKVINCSNKGDLALSNSKCFVGGIQGYTYNGSVDIVGSSNSGNIDIAEGVSGTSAGGILGMSRFYESNYESIWLENCVNSGDISTMVDCTDIYAGGLIGRIYGVPGVYVQKSVNEGSITNGISKTGSATGGIIGSVANVEDSNDVVYEIDSCINMGKLYGNFRVGGIVGGVYKFMASSDVFLIKQCSNRGALSGIESVGGILGVFNESSYDGNTKTYSTAGITLSLCENTGSVLGEKIAGGMIGSICDTEASPKIEVLSCVSAGAVGEGDKGVTTKRSGGFVGHSNEALTVKDSIGYGKLSGEEIHVIGHQDITSQNNLYLAQGDVTDVGGEVAELDLLFQKRLSLEVLAFDRSVLENALSAAQILNKNDYALNSWDELCELIEESKKMLERKDTELTQAELVAQAELLNSTVGQMENPESDQKPSVTEKPTEESDGGCAGSLGGIEVALISVLIFGTAAIKIKK